MKKVIIWILIIIVLVLAGLFIVGKISQRGETAQEQESTGDTTVKEGQEVEPRVQRRTLPPEFENDKDRDGIDDSTEETLGTSSLEADTDGDGLTDKMEIEQWKTYPTKVDTDGDGFSDMEEILNGYNPLGEGTL